MFKNIYPLFEKKRVLKKDMLENLRDYPRDIFQVFYKDYSDGILTGCSLKADDTNLQIQPGIIYFGGIPYLLSETWMVPYEATGHLSYLKVRFLDRAPGVGQDEYLSQIYVDQALPDTKYEIELAQFKLQAGAKLRWEYTDFFDMATEFDTVNRIHVPYAAIGKSSIAPFILNSFAKTLLSHPLQNPLDYAFGMNGIQSNETLSYDAIQTYLNVRLGHNQKDYSNQEIFSSLGTILSQTGETCGKKNFVEPREKKMLLL